MIFEAYFIPAQFVSLFICILWFIKYRLNVFMSLTFTVNLFFLLLYFWPALIFQTKLAKMSQLMIVAGQVSMNMGLLFGYIFDCFLVELGKKKRYVSTSLPSLTIPPMNFLLLIFFTGISIYAALYAMRGIPLFSPNPAEARQAFLSGIGIFTWPAQILIASAIAFSFLRNRVKLSMFLVLIGMGCFLLSGWRGSSFVLLLIVFFIYSYKKEINWKVLILAFVGVLLLGLYVIIRSNISAQAVPGGRLSSGDSYVTVVLMSAAQMMFRMNAELIGFNLAVTYFSDKPLNGAGMLMDMGWMLPGKKYTLVDLMRDKFGEWEGGGGLPVTILGAFYADFGQLGVIVLSFLFAFLQMVLIRSLLRKASKNSLYYLPLGIIGAFWAFGFLGTYFQNYLSIVIVYLLGLFMVLKFYDVLRFTLKQDNLELSSNTPLRVE